MMLSLEEYRMDGRLASQKLHHNILRIANQPVLKVEKKRRLDGSEDDSVLECSPHPATLSKNPKDLFILWKEFEFGLGGRKAAKNFTAVKQGRVKSTYHRRKVEWENIAQQMRAG